MKTPSGPSTAPREWTIYECAACGDTDSLWFVCDCAGNGEGNASVEVKVVERASLDRVVEERDSLKTEYHAAAALLKRRTEYLDLLIEWCKEKGYLADDLPSSTSFDRYLRAALQSGEGGTA